MGMFHISAHWINADSDEDLSVTERATFAEVSIRLGEEVVTRVVDSSGERSFVRGPASGLAEWIVDQWSSILWESHAPFATSAGAGSGHAKPPSMGDAARWWVDSNGYRRWSNDLAALGHWQQRHTIGAGTSDLALPSVILMPEEGAVGVFVAPIDAILDPTVRFRTSIDEPVWVRVEDMRSVLGAFVDQTIAKVRKAAHNPWVDWMESRWQKAKAMEQDPQHRLRVSVGAFAAERWQMASAKLGADAEALRGFLLDTDIVQDPATWAKRIAEVEHTRLAAGRVQTWSPPALPPGLPPFSQGQFLAESLRNHLENTSAPIDLMEAFENLGVAVSVVDTTSAFRSAVIRADDGHARVLFQREGSVARERFSLAAALGRLFADSRSPRGPLGAAQGPASRWRAARRANAFAAELLLPAAAIAARGSSSDQDLCEDYGISRRAAAWQIENRGAARPWS